MREIEVRGEVIRLGQLLKVAGLAESGGEAKALLAAGEVQVNGEPETRRGRQLHDGDVVAAGDETVRVVGGG
jgi:ribosome-associated protein